MSSYAKPTRNINRKSRFLSNIGKKGKIGQWDFFPERTQFCLKMCMLMQNSRSICGNTLFHLSRPPCSLQILSGWTVHFHPKLEVNNVASWSYFSFYYIYSQRLFPFFQPSAGEWGKAKYWKNAGKKKNFEMLYISYFIE